MSNNHLLSIQKGGSGGSCHGNDFLRLFSWLHAASRGNKYQFEIQLSLSRGLGRALHLPVGQSQCYTLQPHLCFPFL